MKTFLFLLLALPFLGIAQNGINLNKTCLNNLDKVSMDILDSTDIYVNDGESTELFYYALTPTDSIQGTLVLFPPTWQPTEVVINHNIELLERAHAENLLVIVPSINFNLYMDATSLSFVNQTLSHVIDSYNAPADKFVFGGFSLGGMNAIRYAELAYENDSLTTVKPVAVYGVDPPLDFARLHRSFEGAIKKNFSKPAIYESKVYLEKLHQNFGGSPDEFPAIYDEHSMFAKDQENGGNAQYLSTVPVRIYCDPDIDWHLKERRVDYNDMNAIDQAAFINTLHLMGNEKAEFVNKLGKGYRMDGRRHPHSWSLVDAEECIEWIHDCLK